MSRIVAWVSGVTLDGCVSGPDGPMHDSWLQEHAMHEQTSEYFEGIWRGAGTILIGRHNFEGFAAVWPGMTADESTPPRYRALGRWMEETEKVLVSRTLTEAPGTWGPARLAPDLVAEATALREAPGRDVLVLSSPSVIQGLLAADLLDDLRFMLVPVTVGGGLRLLPDGLPAARWETAGVTTTASGAVGLHYRRRR